ncbi:MAG: ABC transporter permease [Anaerolineales bacterium]|jgi:peptide/nickel transport system permease protein
MRSLRTYIISRFLLTIPMLLVLVTLVFLILHVMPGDPIRVMVRPGAPKAYIADLRHAVGLDKPLWLNFRGSEAELLLEQAMLLDEPALGSEEVITITPEDTLTVTAREGDWVEVFVEGRRNRGWIPKQSLDVAIRPFDSQYFNYLFDLLRFDLGTSIAPSRGRPVIRDLKDKFPATLELSLFSVVVTALIGIFSGAYAAHRRRSPADYTLRIWSIVVYALPVFWLGLVMQLIFGVALGWLPVSGRISPLIARPPTITGMYTVDALLAGEFATFFDALAHLVLPSITLGLYLAGMFTRLTRSNMLDVLRQDFITAARARGIRERVVVYRHALRNAMIPIVTMLGLQFALLLAGAVLTESTFSWPGLGRFLAERISYRDFSSIQSSVVLFALIIAGVSLIVDILYAYLDPRIRY